MYTASGRIQTTFNIILGGRILAQYKMVYPSTQSVVYFYLDNLNSRRVVLASSGTVLDRYRYTAWGVAAQDAGSDDYRSFTGKDYDATELVYFNARYYDPTTGRFLTEDSSRQGVNWYAYCGNNPVNRTDQTGRYAVQDVGEGITYREDTGRFYQGSGSLVNAPSNRGDGARASQETIARMIASRRPEVVGRPDLVGYSADVELRRANLIPEHSGAVRIGVGVSANLGWLGWSGSVGVGGQGPGLFFADYSFTVTPTAAYGVSLDAFISGNSPQVELSFGPNKYMSFGLLSTSNMEVFDPSSIGFQGIAVHLGWGRSSPVNLSFSLPKEAR